MGSSSESGVGTTRAGGSAVLTARPAGPGSGSVKAKDGSTLSWRTAADGTISVIGSEGREVMITPARKSALHLGGRLEFEKRHGHSQKTYLTLASSYDERKRAATLDIAGGGSEIKVSIQANGPFADSGQGTVTGHFGGKPFEWHGPVSLRKSPRATFGQAPGFEAHAFDVEFEEASHFDPALSYLAGGHETGSGGHEEITMDAVIGPGQFFGKAVVSGVAGIVTYFVGATGEWVHNATDANFQEDEPGGGDDEP